MTPEISSTLSPITRILDQITPLFMSFSSIEVLVILIVIFLAYLVRGIAGFGSGLIAVPFLATQLPIGLVVPLVVSLDYIASASQGLKNRVDIQWREVISLLPFSFIGIFLGVYLFKMVDGEVVKQALGAFILVYAIYSLICSNYDIKKAGSKLWLMPAGSLGGCIGTIFGAGGPFYIIYLKHRALTKTQLKATFAIIFLIDGAGRLIGYFLSDMLDKTYLLVLILMLPCMFIALFIGGKIHLKLSQEVFQRAISVLLVISGLVLLLK